MNVKDLKAEYYCTYEGGLVDEAVCTRGGCPEHPKYYSAAEVMKMLNSILAITQKEHADAEATRNGRK